MRMIKLRAIHSIHILVKVHKNRASISLHTCRACSITMLRLGLRAPLIAREGFRDTSDMVEKSRDCFSGVG